MKHRGNKLQRKFLTIALLIPLAIICMMGPADSEATAFQPGYSTSYALVVGINTYKNWPDLEYAAKDAAEIAAVLKQKNFRVFSLTNQQATRQNILRQLETIRKSIDANSRVVFYFAGHGQTEDLPGGRERGYIVPADADAYDWQGTMLPMDHLNRKIKLFRAKHVLLAFDSCYSGLGLTRSIKRHQKQDAVYINKMMHTRSIQILTAGSRSEQAVEAEGHGLFTDHLLAALDGAADINGDGHITATEIYATVRPSITKQSHSRQTPQFGYIEGNGDIIFYNTPSVKDPTTVLIDTTVNGIDVWAGTSEIGHRLKVGRHRLPAFAGATTIIVKKGGRTLYRKAVRLQANRVFPIRIGSSVPVSRRREPFAMLSITGRNVKDYSNSIAYDLDKDGREEVVTASGSSLYAFKADGSMIWQRRFKFPITLNLIDDWDSQTAIGLSGVDNTKVHLVFLGSDGQELWHHVRKIRHYHHGKPDGGGRIARLVDIDLDGRKEIIAITTAGHALKPRGIIAYDKNAKELWRYLIGPRPQNIVIWENRGRRPDIIIGTYSSADGNHEMHNDTSDRLSYIISVDGYGKTNWVLRMGEYYTGVGVLLGNLDNDDRQYLYAHKYSSSKLREDEGGIYKISKSGKILQRFDTQNSILSVALTSPASDRVESFYAADNKLNLYRLDGRLNLLQEKALQASSAAREIRIVGVHDYDGDGQNDILLYSFERLMNDKNPLSAERPKSKVFYSNLKLQIYSQDLSRLIKSISLSEGWEKKYGFAVTDLNRPEALHYPFMALSDKIIVYNF
jgi:hypothetical protein